MAAMHHVDVRMFVWAALAAAFLVWSAPGFAQDQVPANAPELRSNISDEAAPAQPTQAQDDADIGSYKLDTGDKIRVTVFGKDNENLGGDFELDGTGTIRLPLIGNVRAAGLTPQALSDVIAQGLGAGYLINPRVSVSMLTYRPFYILGEVFKPGAYPYASHMTALNAIALAGGYTNHAMNSKLYIQRLGETEAHEYPADQTTVIHPGDIVRVPQTAFWSFMSYAIPLAGFRPYSY